MRNLGLKARMAVVGSILFAFYTVGIGFFYLTFGAPIPLLVGLSVVFVLFQYKLSKWFTLRSLKGQELPEEKYPEIHRFVERTSREMGIEKPTLYLVEMGVPNAFALGRQGNGTVAVSRELLQMLDRDEVEGVVAHELAHLQNRDSIVMQLGQGVASVVGFAAYFAVLMSGDNDLVNVFLGLIVSNIAQMLVMVFVFAISRHREYVADEDAAEVLGRGDPLARALEKISRGAQRRDPTDEAKEVSALCIFGTGGSLLSTHPPTEKRIERLRRY
ncbi:M48 family metallopeptidase [Halorientalis litorea]|jgi:heat shock protein HtpX|uniref:M48 family metallopeptidase n=1 Tax=Halorientalis litorea TaxID=2931977 RepID=UPI001FF232C3|nr:M48 family metalloprotease [Halorientalis litorea]